MTDMSFDWRMFLFSFLPVEISKHSTSVDKEARRSRFPPTPVPPHPLKSQSLPVPAKASQLPPATSKHPPHPTPPQRPLSPPAPIPTSQKSPSSTSPPPPTKTATSSKPQSPPPFTPAKPVSRAPGLPSQTPASQRGLPPPASPQDEPPWMALAKKKAKAWSEMPQIVQWPGYWFQWDLVHGPKRVRSDPVESPDGPECICTQRVAVSCGFFLLPGVSPGLSLPIGLQTSQSQLKTDSVSLLLSSRPYVVHWCFLNGRVGTPPLISILFYANMCLNERRSLQSHSREYI